jgi:hypothetical protein
MRSRVPMTAVVTFAVSLLSGISPASLVSERVRSAMEILDERRAASPRDKLINAARDGLRGSESTGLATAIQRTARVARNLERAFPDDFDFRLAFDDAATQFESEVRADRDALAFLVDTLPPSRAVAAARRSLRRGDKPLGRAPSALSAAAALKLLAKAEAAFSSGHRMALGANWLVLDLDGRTLVSTQVTGSIALQPPFLDWSVGLLADLRNDEGPVLLYFGGISFNDAGRPMSSPEFMGTLELRRDIVPEEYGPDFSLPRTLTVGAMDPGAHTLIGSFTCTAQLVHVWVDPERRIAVSGRFRIGRAQTRE